MQACADDLGAVVGSIRHLAALCPPLSLIKFAAGLSLNFKKCVIVPLAPFSPQVVSRIRRWLSELAPEWISVRIVDKTKYLGCIIGPAATSHDNFAKPFIKFAGRVLSIGETPLPHAPAVKAYN